MCGVYSVPHTHILRTHRRTNIHTGAGGGRSRAVALKHTHTTVHQLCAAESETAFNPVITGNLKPATSTANTRNCVTRHRNSCACAHMIHNSDTIYWMRVAQRKNPIRTSSNLRAIRLFRMARNVERPAGQ